MSLALEGVELPLDRFVLRVDFSYSGKVLGLFGSSGSGKTTLLEIVAGIRKPARARIQLEEDVLTDTAAGIHVDVESRGIGYVPQDLALFPHLTVKKNLLFGYRPSLFETPISPDHITEVLEIGPILHRRIESLSGGEKQRVAFWRAILASPRLLLLDEPLANLDVSLKKKMLDTLQRLRKEFSIPMLYVSHDPEEVVQLCDEIIVLEAGQVVAKGKPEELFQSVPSIRHLPAWNGSLS